MNIRPEIQEVLTLLGVNAHTFIEASVRGVQKNYSLLLRQKTVEFMEKSADLRDFYQAYAVTANRNNPIESYDEFLMNQKKDRVWAESFTVLALAQMIKSNLQMVLKQKGKNYSFVYQGDASNLDPSPMTIFNRSNVHFYVDSTTIEDGNCFYNSILQACQKQMKIDNGLSAAPAGIAALMESATVIKTSSQILSTLQKDAQEDVVVINWQESILTHLQKSKAADAIPAEDKVLPRYAEKTAEQKNDIETQIAIDFHLAMETARKDYDEDKTSVIQPRRK